MGFRQARKVAGLTQQEVAESLGVTRVSVARWEGEIFEPDITTIKRLAELYKCDINDLLNPSLPLPMRPRRRGQKAAAIANT